MQERTAVCAPVLICCFTLMHFLRLGFWEMNRLRGPLNPSAGKGKVQGRKGVGAGVSDPRSQQSYLLLFSDSF